VDRGRTGNLIYRDADATIMKNYPKNWSEIRREILLRAGGNEDDPRVGARCEKCGVLKAIVKPTWKRLKLEELSTLSRFFKLVRYIPIWFRQAVRYEYLIVALWYWWQDVSPYLDHEFPQGETRYHAIPVDHMDELLRILRRNT
jgi:hypothetical protein